MNLNKKNLITRNKNEYNFYINGEAFYYDYYYRNDTQSNFLIPRTHLSLFKLGLSRGTDFVYKTNKEWVRVMFESQILHEDIYMNENHFEYSIIGTIKVLDEIELRDLKLKYLIEN